MEMARLQSFPRMMVNSRWIVAASISARSLACLNLSPSLVVTITVACPQVGGGVRPSQVVLAARDSVAYRVGELFWFLYLSNAALVLPAQFVDREPPLRAWR